MIPLVNVYASNISSFKKKFIKKYIIEERKYNKMTDDIIFGFENLKNIINIRLIQLH